MKKTLYIFTVFLFCGVLIGCSQSSNSNTDNDTSPLIKGVNPQNIEDLRNEQTQKEIIIRRDPENLVEIHIDRGIAEAYFNLVRWDELYNIGEFTPLDSIYDGAYPINGLSGKVKDACIAQIEDLNISGDTEITPYVFLLMDDGKVEWAPALMFSQSPEWPELFSQGELPWIKDMVSLSIVKDAEVNGGVTVYGEDSQGKIYDLRIPALFHELCTASWVADLYNVEPFYLEGYYAVLGFSENGTALLEKGWLDEAKSEVYTGTYELEMMVGQNKKPGTLTLKLQFSSKDKNSSPQNKIHGNFVANIDLFYHLKLTHSSGDYLHVGESGYFDNINFSFDFNPFEKRD